MPFDLTLRKAAAAALRQAKSYSLTLALTSPQAEQRYLLEDKAIRRNKSNHPHIGTRQRNPLLR